MGELVDLERERRARAVARELAALLDRLSGPSPAPESWGWRVAARDASGQPARWVSLRYRATIGVVPGAPGRVYLDYRQEIRAWDGLSIEDLALGLEAGTLPEPDLTLDWRGEPERGG